jgi:hypothetical protein
VAAVLVVGLAAGVTIALLIKSSSDRRTKERAIVNGFIGTVNQAITPVAQAFQDSYVPFPDLTRAFSQLQGGGTVDTNQVVTTANSNSKLALAAYNAINQIPVANDIQGHPDLLDLIDAQNFLTQSLKLFQQVADILKDAAQATGDAQTTLVTQAQGLLSVGATLFQDGYQKINNLRTELGIPAPVVAPPGPSGPTGQTSPSPSPSAKASTKPHAKRSGHASPKPKASGSPTG